MIKIAHLFIGAEGCSHWVDKFKNDMEAQWLPHGNGEIQIAMREIRFFDIVYPKECEEQVLSYMHPFNRKGPKNVIISSAMKLIKKTLKLKDVKTPEKGSTKVHRPFVNIHVIGKKDDMISDDGIEQL